MSIQPNVPGTPSPQHYSYTARADTKSDLHHEQPGPQASIEVVNYSNNLVLISFESVTQITRDWDMIVPPWMGRVQPYAGSGLLTTVVVGTNQASGPYDGVRVSLSPVEMIPSYYPLPQVQGVSMGAKYYSSSAEITLAASASYDSNTAGAILPPNEWLGATFTNMSAAGGPDVWFALSGDATWTNPAPSSGYIDPSARQIWLKAGQSIMLPLTMPGQTNGGRVIMTNASASISAQAQWVFVGN